MPAKYVLILRILAVSILFFRTDPATAVQGVRLGWEASPSPEVVGYNVYYGAGRGYYSKSVSGVTATELDIADLEEGLTYYFVVTAYNGSGEESGLSNEAFYTVAGLAPPDRAPYVLQILPDHALTLGWNPSRSTAVQGYYVRYGTQSGAYDTVLWVEDRTEIEIHGLAEGLTYFFVVTAVDHSGRESVPTPESAFSFPRLAPPKSAPTISPALFDQGVTLAWQPSPTGVAAGYKVYYGTLSGLYDNWFYVGDVGSVEIGGLAEGVTYFFAVSAYDSAGQESALSAEATYYSALTVAVAPQILLSLQQVSAAGFPNTFSITASGPVPASWVVEGSPDMKSWYTLATGAEPEVNVALVVTEKPSLFFRLTSWFSDINLEIQAPETNGFPNTLVVSTPYAVPWEWTVESSENMADWSPLVAGFYAPVKVAIVNSAAPAMFFRLKGNN